MKMTWAQFFERVKADDVAKLYLFAGAERYMLRSAEEALRARLLPDGLEAMNETTLNAPDAQAIIEACETVPFMARKRLVFARDCALLQSGKARDEAAQAERLAAWFRDMPDTCCLVFPAGDALDLRKKTAQAIQQAGVVVAFDALEEADLRRWIAKRAAKLDARISDRAQSKLIFYAGGALTTLDAELQKLAAYAGSGGEIDEAAIEALVTPSAETTVFRMIDALTDGKQAQAQTLLKTLLRAGESRIGVIAMLTRQMRLLTHIVLAAERGEPLAKTEALLGIKHFSASRLSQQARRMERDKLLAAYRACVDADFAIKSGRARDEAALDKLMLELGRWT